MDGNSVLNMNPGTSDISEVSWSLTTGSTVRGCISDPVVTRTTSRFEGTFYATLRLVDVTFEAIRTYCSVPGKRPGACFGCTNGERPLPGKRPGYILTVTHGKRPGSFCTPSTSKGACIKARSTERRYTKAWPTTGSIVHRLYPQQAAESRQ